MYTLLFDLAAGILLIFFVSHETLRPAFLVLIVVLVLIFTIASLGMNTNE